MDETYQATHPDVQPGSYVMLAVADTGCGMDAETMSRIFEPFFTTKQLGKGTGLGLSTIYGIIKQSGGHIEVRSEVDHGATIQVFLPRSHSLSFPKKSNQGISTTPEGHETVLVVEDEEGVRSLVRMILESNGYDVLDARDGEEAIKICEEHAIDLLLTDVVMPKRSGPQLVKWLAGTMPNLKVLYISGHSDEMLGSRGVLPPGADLLKKPFTSTALARMVRQVLDAPPNHAALC